MEHFIGKLYKLQYNLMQLISRHADVSLEYCKGKYLLYQLYFFNYAYPFHQNI